MTNLPPHIQQELDRLIETGDDKMLENFLLEHLKELPEELQQKLIFSFFEEAVLAQNGEGSVADIQEKGIAALEQIADIKREILESKPE